MTIYIMNYAVWIAGQNYPLVLIRRRWSISKEERWRQLVARQRVRSSGTLKLKRTNKQRRLKKGVAFAAPLLFLSMTIHISSFLPVFLDASHM